MTKWQFWLSIFLYNRCNNKNSVPLWWIAPFVPIATLRHLAKKLFKKFLPSLACIILASLD